MESSLIAAAKGGDASAFETLMGAYERKVYDLCLRMMGNPHDGEDCAQEAMLRIWQRLSQYRGDSAFSTWVYRVTASCCLDALRRRRPQSSLEAMQEDGFDARDDAPTPPEAHEAREMQRAIAGALADVPADMRSVFLLRDVHGLSVEDTARALGISGGTVKSRLSRVREKLARSLRAQGFGPQNRDGR